MPRPRSSPPLGSAVVVLALGLGMLAGVLGAGELPLAALLVVAGAAALVAAGYGLAQLASWRRALARRPAGCRRATGRAGR
jgi:hypothetical protein